MKQIAYSFRLAVWKPFCFRYLSSSAVAIVPLSLIFITLYTGPKIKMNSCSLPLFLVEYLKGLVVLVYFRWFINRYLTGLYWKILALLSCCFSDLINILQYIQFPFGSSSETILGNAQNWNRELDLGPLKHFNWLGNSRLSQNIYYGRLISGRTTWWQGILSLRYAFLSADQFEKVNDSVYDTA